MGLKREFALSIAVLHSSALEEETPCNITNGESGLAISVHYLF
jgi:hypothetical protein